MPGDERPETAETPMKPPPYKPHLDIVELESAFEFLASVDPSFQDEPCVSFLDLTTGKLVAPKDNEAADALFDDEKHLHLPGDLFEDMAYGGLQ
jgi:hypothetical protein